ncbi:cytochrome c peroxidase [Variovorax sp. YR216]|nr:cytochrome c peroxidase [Variovorax sp. YR216]
MSSCSVRTAPGASRRLAAAAFMATGAVFLAGCGGGGGGSGGSPLVIAATSTTQAVPGTTVTAASIGEKIFSDRSLSASGQMACATCHDPATGHASPFSTPVAFGGPNLDQAGTRSPPSLRYLRFNTPFFLASDGTPTGGFDWDGRAATLADQARRPFLSANEMANADVATVVAKVAAAAYAADFKALFGANIFADPDTAFDRVVFSLERYQRESDEFAPFTSKFDYFTAGKAAFNDQESRGLALFNRPDKGNCAACHASIKPSNAPGALFTDFTFDSLGLPRNMAIPANADPAYFDMGLCGPARTDLANRTDLCGAFKVPSLRNVALRHHFFHNGQFDSLEQVVRFYVRRDTNPEEWFPVDPGTGQPDAYNDLPPERRGNVNVTEVPYNKKAGEQPYLDESEIQDLVAFLKTLTDGYAP